MQFVGEELVHGEQHFLGFLLFERAHDGFLNLELCEESIHKLQLEMPLGLCMPLFRGLFEDQRHAESLEDFLPEPPARMLLCLLVSLPHSQGQQPVVESLPTYSPHPLILKLLGRSTQG